MMKISEIVGDIVFLKFANPEYLYDIGINGHDGHFLIKGKDELGLWIQHPRLEIVKVLDKNGKPLPEKKTSKEKNRSNCFNNLAKYNFNNALPK